MRTDEMLKVEEMQAEIARLTDLAYAPDGRETRTVLFEEAAKRGELEAERDALREQMGTIAERAKDAMLHRISKEAAMGDIYEIASAHEQRAMPEKEDEFFYNPHTGRVAGED